MFGDILKKLIEEKGIDQKKFGEIFNLSKQAISGYVTNKRIPSVELLIKFADYFNCTVDYLIGRTDKPYFELIENNLPKEIIDAGIHAIKVFKGIKVEDLTTEDIKNLVEFTEKVERKNRP